MVVAHNAGVKKSGAPISVGGSDDTSELGDEQVLSDEDTIQAERIISAISGSATDGEVSVQVGDEDLQVDLQHLLLESLEDTPVRDEHDRVHVPAEDFIRFFAQINVIRNRNAARLTDANFEKEAAHWVATGNSRDPPTRFLFCCPQKEWGCTFSARVMAKLEVHIVSCKISKEQPFMQKELLFHCRRAGCSERFTCVGSRSRHEREHDWVARQCSRGCTDGRWFMTKESWDTHVRTVHEDTWNALTTCPFPGCTRESPFGSRDAYRNHLRCTHKLSSEEMDEYRVASTYRGPAFGLRLCPHQDCAGSDTRRKRRDLEAHLKSRRGGGHGLVAEEATRMVDEMLR